MRRSLDTLCASASIPPPPAIANAASFMRRQFEQPRTRFAVLDSHSLWSAWSKKNASNVPKTLPMMSAMPPRAGRYPGPEHRGVSPPRAPPGQLRPLSSPSAASSSPSCPRQQEGHRPHRRHVALYTGTRHPGHTCHRGSGGRGNSVRGSPSSMTFLNPAAPANTRRSSERFCHSQPQEQHSHGTPT